MRRMTLLLGAVLMAFGMTQPALTANPKSVADTVPAITATDSCARLATPNLRDAQGKLVDFSRIQDAPTHIVSATVVAAAGDVPAYCLAKGYVSPQVGIELRMPVAGWNGKFAMVGCGGMCGGVQEPGCDVPLIKGYSCIMSDMGHRGTQIDAEWAYNNLQGEVDFGYRASHVATLAGKAITRVYYGKMPGYSYFLGCSTGGRQALVEAQRFPYDYDGILSGSPPLNEIADGLDILWSVQKAMRADHSPLLTGASLELVNRAAVAACDMDDGVKDGVIGNPPMCRFDPRKLVCKAGQKGGCLSAEQAHAVQEIYDGPHDSKGRNWYFGVYPGSELNWIGSLQRDDGQISHYEAFMTSMNRFLNYMPDAGPNWTIANYDWDVDPKRTGLMETLMNAQNPDLRAFKAQGGKLIGFHGWNDHIVQPGANVDYYQTVERTMGGRDQTQDFYRLFMMPGLNHCQGGVGAYAVDWLGALEDWVERGKAPDRLLAVKPVDPKGGLYPRAFTPAPGVMENAIFSRPLFPFPLRAVYDGKGDPNSADSFVAQ